MTTWLYWYIVLLSYHLVTIKMVFGGSLGGLWGLLGALGAILAHLGPKSQHNTKNHRSLDPPPLHLGAILGPKLGLCWASFIKNVFRNTIGKHVASKHHFFSETLASLDHSGHQKSSKTIGGVSKIRVCTYTRKVALGRGLGSLFGRFFGPKLGPSWAKLGHVGT